MRFNPKTPAKLLKTLGEVVNLVVAKKVTEVLRVVEEWEVKVGRLAAEFEEVLSEALKVAILIQMIPQELRDMVFQMGTRSGAELEYKAG
jgi:hypothetical protein